MKSSEVVTQGAAADRSVSRCELRLSGRCNSECTAHSPCERSPNTMPVEQWSWSWCEWSASRWVRLIVAREMEPWS